MKARSDWSMFGLWSEFIRRSVHTRLQFSVCTSYHLCHSD